MDGREHEFLYYDLFDSVPSVSIPDEKRVAEDEGTVQVCATLNISLYTTAVNITVTLGTSDYTGKQCLLRMHAL